MEETGSQNSLEYEIKIRNLMLETGKSRSELEKEMEEFRPRSKAPNASPSVLAAIFAATVYGIHREDLERPADKILVLKSSKRISRNGNAYTVYDAVNFEGKLVRLFDYYGVCKMKAGYMYRVAGFKFMDNMYTYRLGDRTSVTELGKGKLSSIISFQLIPDVDGVGFCRLNVVGVKEGLFKVCPECGRKVDSICGVCKKKGVNKKWRMLDVVDGVNSGAKMFLKVDDSLADIKFSDGEWIHALVQKQFDSRKRETYNIIYFEKEEETESAQDSASAESSANVMDEIVAERIVSILVETPCSKEQLYEKLRKNVPVGEEQFARVLDRLMQTNRVGEEDGLYWSKL
ncbi:MAG: hypothetical protein QW491_14575 [Thermoproteota archaeon]